MVDLIRRDKINYEVRNFLEKCFLIISIKKFNFLLGLVTYTINQASVKIYNFFGKNYNTKSDISVFLIIQSKKLKATPTNILKLTPSKHLFFIKIETEKHNLYNSLVFLLLTFNSYKSLSVVQLMAL
tara:strand:+ start:371 stop:751 length:381 start_codon:yes stop_codon:yes gene_type:complete